MPHINNVLSFAGGAAAGRRVSLSDTEEKVVKSCRGVVARALPQLLAGLFEKIDDALYELADKADNNSLQTGYFSAMRDIRKERAKVERDFRSTLLDDYDRFWQSGVSRADSGQEGGGGILESDLALVADDELEESLAVNNMISKGENRYHRELYALDQRLGCLLPGVHVDNQTNPLAPATFCNAFRDAIRSIEVDIPVKLVIYKLFDRQVMHYVGGLYDEINTLFGQAGIMPKLTPKVRRNPVAPGLSRPEDKQGTARGRQESERQGYSDSAERGVGVDGGYSGHRGDEEVQAEIFNLLQQMLSARRNGAPAAPNGVSTPRYPVGGASLPVVDTRELLGVLSSLQHSNVVPLYTTPVDAAASVSTLRTRLAEELELVFDGEARKAIGQADEDAIDVIAMLFEFILEDKNLPDAMKVLLSRLQIPMLKLAIMDKSFFSKTLHPARRLLNNLAQAATGWNDEGDPGKDGLYAKVESMVQRVLTDFEDDPGLFARLNDEFSEFLEKERRGAEVTEERTTQVTRGKEQLKAAKQRVAHEIDSRLATHSNVPEVVRSLLQEGWKDVLLLNYLRQGPDSEAWRSSVNLIDKLLWSVEPKTAAAERQELLRDIPELLKSLREGLTGISYDQHKMAHLLKELQSCHISCLRGNYAGDETVADREGIPPAQARPLPGKTGQNRQVGASASQVHAPWQGGQTRGAKEGHLASRDEKGHEQDAHTERAESIKVGTWMEITATDGVKLRVKLSWKSDVSDAYVFVNRKGVKVMEMTMRGLAEEFRQGRAQILDNVDAPLMDRALSAMMDSLQHQAEGVTPRHQV